MFRVAFAIHANVASFFAFQASLDRGYGRCQVLRKNATLIRKYPNGTFDRLADAPLDDNGQLQKKYDIIQADGLAGVGERVDPGDVYINKQTPTNANDNTFTGQAASVPYKNSPMTYKSPVAGHIDKVMITDTDNDQTLIKVLIRQTRRPELGDKFSSRHGQKGVCGLIVNQEDMPFNDQGIVPGTSQFLPCTSRAWTRFRSSAARVFWCVITGAGPWERGTCGRWRAAFAWFRPIDTSTALIDPRHETS